MEFSPPRVSVILWMMMMIMMTVIITTTTAAPLEDDKSGDREKRDTFDMIGMLSEYGYLPKNDEGLKGQVSMSDETVSEGIRSFQKFNGLKVTGYADPETLKKMQSPRCGYPDIIREYDGSTNNEFAFYDQPQSYSVLGSRWRKDTVSWKPTVLSKKLDGSQQMAAFEKALGIWEEVIPLKFRYTNERPDMEIKFATGDHGDGWYNRFNGRGGVLAHAYGPGPGMGGDTHFDEDEDWTVNTGQGSDLLNVAAHEFGHALGLAHSSVPGALMAPYYQYTENLSLHRDDVQGIQRLYGARNPRTTTTTEATTTTTTTTTTPTTTSGRRPWFPGFCRQNFRLDALSKGPDGFMYAYSNDHIYKIGSRGLEVNFPKYITDVFPEAPRKHIRAVTFVPTTGKTYMFKDFRVWRFTGFSLDPGYPKQTTEIYRYRPTAAITLTHGGVSQIFLFGMNMFWEWSTHTERMVPGYPLPMDKYFPSAPVMPDAAYMNGKGNMFFLKYNRLKTMEFRGAEAKTYPLGTGLFGPICGVNQKGKTELVTLEAPPHPQSPPQPQQPPAAPPVKYDESYYYDSSSQNGGQFEYRHQGEQPDYLESPLIKSLLISEAEEQIRKDEEEMRSDEIDIAFQNRLLRWAKTLQSTERRKNPIGLTTIKDVLRRHKK